jgi:hypothetical protein
MRERETAAKAGQITYEGKPCVNGHGTERYVLSNGCVVCDRNNAKRKYQARKAFTQKLKAMREGG